MLGVARTISLLGAIGWTIFAIYHYFNGRNSEEITFVLLTIPNIFTLYFIIFSKSNLVEKDPISELISNLVDNYNLRLKIERNKLKKDLDSKENDGLQDVDQNSSRYKD